MLRVLIVDDEELAAERLKYLCARIDSVSVVGVAGDGRTALSRVADLKPDVLLLDISMPGMNGITLAQLLAKNEDRPAIIFITAHDCHAVEAFELAAIDYLLKPVSLARLTRAIARAIAERRPRPAAFISEIWVPRGRDMFRVDTEALELLEAERDYVRLHTGSGTYLVRMTLTDLELRLDPAHFIRVHRSAIVPLDRISSLQRDTAGSWTVQLSTGGHVRVGRSFQPTIRTILHGLR